MTNDDLLRAASALAGTLGAVAATGGVGTAAAGLAAGVSIFEFARNFGQRNTGLQARIATELKAELSGTSHLTNGHRLLILQMIEKAPLTPQEVMAAARKPAEIAATMLTRLEDSAHEPPMLRAAFTETVVTVLTRLLADRGFCDELRPAFESAVAESFRVLHDQQAEIITLLRDDAKRAHLQEGMLIGLARAYATGNPDSFDSALASVTEALKISADMQARAALPANTGEQVDRVLAEVIRLNNLQRLDAAATEIATALRSEQEATIARQTRLLEMAVQQDQIRNNPASAAAHIVQRLTLEEPDLFHALRAEHNRWYAAGRDKGLAFDLQVSIALAKAALTHASDADERGAALNDLGISLTTLGARASDPALLDEAVTACRAALQEYARDRVPLDWAMTQNNLGAALQALGTRASDPALLDEAVAAYREALQEQTRDRVPLDWATIQNNLGTALQALGTRASGPALLGEAVSAYRAALQEWTRDRVPLDWAMTQNNLGTALQALGDRASDPALLREAVTAFRAALKEWTRDRVPLDWAATQNNLGNALQALVARASDPALLDEAVTAYRAALQEWTRDRVPLNWATTQNNLGNALQSLGESDADTARLDQAAAAYQAALLERTRENVPLDWAGTQGNLAILNLAYISITGDSARLSAARIHTTDARAVFEAAGAGHYLAKADDLLARIAALTP